LEQERDMNDPTTEYILEKLKPYAKLDGIEISTENTDYKGRKHKSDYVCLNAEHNVGFEVYDRAIIVFYFTDHRHFDNYTEEEEDEEYIEWAVEFLIKLFTRKVRCLEIYKGKKLATEKYYFIKDADQEFIGGSWNGFITFINPFAKRTEKSTTWHYDADKNDFVSDCPANPPEVLERSKP
jgi:hypothetical protein